MQDSLLNKLVYEPCLLRQLARSNNHKREFFIDISLLILCQIIIFYLFDVFSCIEPDRYSASFIHEAAAGWQLRSVQTEPRSPFAFAK